MYTKSVQLIFKSEYELKQETSKGKKKFFWD